MPPFYGTGIFVWEVQLLVSGGSPTIIVNDDGSNATRFGGIFCDTIQTTTISVFDTVQGGVMTANKVFSTINQVANSLAAPPAGGCELDNGLVVSFPAALAGNVYVYWR